MYYCYDPTTKKIVVTKDYYDPTTNKIVFDESIIGLQGVKDVSPSFDTSAVIRLNLPIIGKNSA
jgi:hypothetical protein